MVDFKRGSEKSAQQARTPALPAFLAAFAAKIFSLRFTEPLRTVDSRFRAIA